MSEKKSPEYQAGFDQGFAMGLISTLGGLLFLILFCSIVYGPQ